MSATNRGTPREKNDFYETPAWVWKRFFEKFNPFFYGSKTKRWLEPGAGKGATIQAVNSIHEGIDWTAVEIDEQHVLDLAKIPNVFTEVVDFRNYKPDLRFDVCIGNPPYAIAFDFVKEAFRVTDGYIIMLLRTNFLSSEKRSDWMRLHTPDVYILPNRPIFTKGRSDNSEYCVAVWDTRNNTTEEGKVVILNSTPISERKSK